MKLGDIKIDPEFQSAIRKLTDDEFALLEENIVSDGEVRDPLVIWNGLILDGHHRYQILQKHPDIPFKTSEKTEADIPNRAAASAWIYKNQMGKRNLTKEERDYYIGKRYEAEKEIGVVRDESTGRFLPMDQNDPPEEEKGSGHITAKKIAKEIGMGEVYVRRAEQFAKGLDEADKVDPGFREDVLSGKVKTTKKAVTSILSADEKKKKELVEEMRSPKKVTAPDGHRKKSQAVEREECECQNDGSDIIAKSYAPESYYDINTRTGLTIKDTIDALENFFSDSYLRFKSILESHKETLHSQEDRDVVANLVNGYKMKMAVAESKIRYESR